MTFEPVTFVPCMLLSFRARKSRVPEAAWRERPLGLSGQQGQQHHAAQYQQNINRSANAGRK